MLKQFYNAAIIEAGCDEAGRGCLAGPVFAAAVVLPEGFGHPLLNDSKKMTARQRDTLREVIEREAVAWAVESVSAARIDEINILNASFEAMSLAVARLKTTPEHLLIDGNRFRTTLAIPYTCIVGGDGLYASIAAASVLAKTHRDEYMDNLAAHHPEYGWLQNKGYPTKQHRDAIAHHGLTPHHRMTFTVKTIVKKKVGAIATTDRRF
jgi:ribonuclease HII